MNNFTFNEIHQQPAMWRKELQALLNAKAEISAFMHKYLTPDTDVVLTGAGATFPYGKDPADKNIRIAPTYPSLEELEKAMEIFCVCAKMAAAEALIGA